AWVSVLSEQFRWWAGQSSGRRFAEHTVSIVAAFDDPSLRITTNIFVGFAWAIAGDYRRARDSQTTALELLRNESIHQRHGHPRLPSPMAHALLGGALAELGDFDEAIRHGREAVRLAESVGHRFCLMAGLWSLGELHLIKGDFEEAILHLERAVAI